MAAELLYLHDLNRFCSANFGLGFRGPSGGITSSFDLSPHWIALIGTRLVTGWQRDWWQLSAGLALRYQVQK
ncbi:MAG: hypothetical protein ACP5JB_05535 [candidate division WOR-3 bacterium]